MTFVSLRVSLRQESRVTTQKQKGLNRYSIYLVFLQSCSSICCWCTWCTVFCSNLKVTLYFLQIMNVYDLQLWQKYFHGASLSGMENYIFCTESVFRDTIFNIKDQNKIQNFIAISLVNVFSSLKSRLHRPSPLSKIIERYISDCAK